MIAYKLSDLFGVCADWKHPLYKLPFKVTLDNLMKIQINSYFIQLMETIIK